MLAQLLQFCKVASPNVDRFMREQDGWVRKSDLQGYRAIARQQKDDWASFMKSVEERKKQRGE